MLSPENRKKLAAELERDEGRRLKPYKCTAGRTTIGIGRNLDDRGVSNAEADFMLQNDIDHVWEGLVGIFGDSWKEWSEARQRAVCNLIFNLGATGFQQFRRTIDCIRRHDWGLAADAIMKSKYATQVGDRAKRVAEQLRNG